MFLYINILLLDLIVYLRVENRREWRKIFDYIFIWEFLEEKKRGDECRELDEISVFFKWDYGGLNLWEN